MRALWCDGTSMAARLCAHSVCANYVGAHVRMGLCVWSMSAVYWSRASCTGPDGTSMAARRCAHSACANYVGTHVRMGLCVCGSVRVRRCAGMD